MKYNTAYIYKPNRVLYYINPTDAEISEYLSGNMPEALKPYDGAFGTYCGPSLFYIGRGDDVNKVIGIEFRPEDNHIDYPRDLDSMIIEASFLQSVNLHENNFFAGKDIASSAEEIRQLVKNAEFYFDHVEVMDEPDLMVIDNSRGHDKIYFKAKDVTEEEFFYEPVLNTETEKRLYNASITDGITGYYNWNHIWPIITGFGLKGVQDFAFAHFDIKDFKAINFIYGHGVANRLLCRITEKMRDLPWIHYSARCDNDNFCMMIKDMPIEETLDHLQKFFEDLLHLEEDNSFHIYFRCGVVPMKNAIAQGNRVADAAKHIQRQCNKLYETEIMVYTDQMDEDLEWTEKIKGYLNKAIERDEFLVYLQPKYDIRDNSVHGAEALIRWMYRGKQLLSPFRFIPTFETGGLISKLDDIVLHKVCGYLKRWKEEGKRLYPISVNLSRKSLGNPHLTEHLISIVDSYGVDHSLIDFELTESAAYDNQRYMIEVITELKANGFLISMDDFGTGFSSLSLLTVMPLDTLKIDKSFVDNIGDSADKTKDQIVVKQIIDLAKNLGFVCLAEGAEDKDQVDKLREYGCEIVQGYYYSKPLPVDEFIEKVYG